MPVFGVETESASEEWTHRLTWTIGDYPKDFGSYFPNLPGFWRRTPPSAWQANNLTEELSSGNYLFFPHDIVEVATIPI
jgi:hypothetical protein